ncbi:hypothetical protein F4780DRAFT_797035 [Xylariomycetidae sp. FL0641]|nr:hypothetical protein F4780DRAFT_797035 [Xylariomycetidae sp. FL0641]
MSSAAERRTVTLYRGFKRERGGDFHTKHQTAAYFTPDLEYARYCAKGNGKIICITVPRDFLKQGYKFDDQPGQEWYHVNKRRRAREYGSRVVSRRVTDALICNPCLGTALHYFDPSKAFPVCTSYLPSSTLHHASLAIMSTSGECLLDPTSREYKRLVRRGRWIHPWLPGSITDPAESAEGLKFVPALDDKREILRFMGANDECVAWALGQYRAKYASDPESLITRVRRNAYHDHGEEWAFPMLDRLQRIVTRRHIDYDPALKQNLGKRMAQRNKPAFVKKGASTNNSGSAEDFIKGGVRFGLRPEFAIFCGLQPSDEDYHDEAAVADFYASHDYQDEAAEIMHQWADACYLLWHGILNKGETKLPMKAEEQDMNRRLPKQNGVRVKTKRAFRTTHKHTVIRHIGVRSRSSASTHSYGTQADAQAAVNSST